jgi:transposase-like protein
MTALLHLLKARRADCRHENPPPRSHSHRPVCVRRLLLPTRGHRAGGPLVPTLALSYRDVEELLAERGIEVDHVTIYRWVQRFTPLLAEAARPCRHAVGDRWLVDETDVKVAGRWRYVDRAIDQFGQVIDVFVSPRRDVKAARRFFEQAISVTRVAPVEVTTDRFREPAGARRDAVPSVRGQEARAHWRQALAIFKRLQTTDAEQVRALLADLPGSPRR